MEEIVDELLIYSTNYKKNKETQIIINFITILCKHNGLYHYFLFHNSDTYKQKLIKLMSHNNLEIR